MIPLYECSTCEQLHRWAWSGDCRDDANRFASVTDFIERTGRVLEDDVQVFAAADLERSDCHPDCGPIVAGSGLGTEHAHENEDGRCWHAADDLGY